MPERSSPPSPVDGMPGTQLEARVVRPGARPLLQGYDLQGELAAHFSFAEVVLTALTGEAPSEKAGRAMEVALVFAAPITIAEAPSHLAHLARRCGADHAGVFGVAAIALAEEARQRVAREPGMPAAEDAEAIARLGAALEARGVAIPAAAVAPSLWEAILAVFHFCGLREDWQLEHVIALARIPVAVAEGMAVSRGDPRGYPMRQPPFAYEERART